MVSLKSNIEKPYYSNGPLNRDTVWVAFPIAIYVRNKNYSSGLERGKEIVSKLESAIEDLATEECRIGEPDVSEEELDLETVVEFRKLGSDHTTQIYHHLAVNFTGKPDLWNKMNTITRFLDAIVTFSSQYEKDKQVDIYFGSRNSFVK